MQQRIWGLFLLSFISKVLIAQDSLWNLKTTVLSEADSFNYALINGDIEALYRYSNKIDIKSMSFEEFKMDCEQTVLALKKSETRVEGITIKEISPIVKCGNEYQCLLRRVTLMSMSEKQYSFETYLVAFSMNKTNWTFTSIQIMTYKQALNLYPNLCENLFRKE